MQMISDIPDCFQYADSYHYCYRIEIIIYYSLITNHNPLKRVSIFNDNCTEWSNLSLAKIYQPRVLKSRWSQVANSDFLRTWALYGKSDGVNSVKYGTGNALVSNTMAVMYFVHVQNIYCHICQSNGFSSNLVALWMLFLWK